MGRLKGLLFSVALLPSLTLASEWVYTVQPGDNLWNLTERYMLSMRYWLPLLELNGIEQPKRMPPGTRLRMPLQWSKVSRVGARIVDVHGKVEIRDRQGTQRPAHTGELLRAHDQVVTEPGSSLLLEFGDKTQLLLTGDSSLELEKMQGYGEGDVIDSRMHLRRGGSESLVNPDKKSGSRFEIFTPSALTSVRGTGFRITNEDAGKASKVEVTSGRVQVVEPKRTLDLKGGFGLIARQGKPPSKPVRLLPAPALAAVPELIEDPVPTFELAPLAGAKGYRVQVSARGDFTAPTIDNRYSDEQIRIDLSSLPDGDYQMRIRGIDSQGIEGRDAIRLVKLNIRPPPPFQVFPTAESAFDDPRPKFEWAKPEGGSGYRFELARDPEMDKPILVLPRLSSEQVTPSGDLEPGPYYWRVSTLDENGKSGPLGYPQPFRVLPKAPRTEPPEVDDQGLTFHWRPGAPGQQFHFQLATDPEFERIIEDLRTEQPRHHVSAPPPDTYFMRIRTIDKDGVAGPFGRTQSIEVKGREDHGWFVLLPLSLWLLLVL